VAANADRGTHHMRTRSADTFVSLWPLWHCPLTAASRDGTTSGQRRGNGFRQSATVVTPLPPPGASKLTDRRDSWSRDWRGQPAAVMCLTAVTVSHLYRIPMQSSASAADCGSPIPVTSSVASVRRPDVLVVLPHWFALFAARLCSPFSRVRADGACEASRPATVELCPVKVMHGPRWISRLGCALTRRQLHPGTAAPPVDNTTKYYDKVM